MNWLNRMTKRLNEFDRKHPMINPVMAVIALIVSLIALVVTW